MGDGRGIAVSGHGLKSIPMTDSSNHTRLKAVTES
jgi:hypothetical protein